MSDKKQTWTPAFRKDVLKAVDDIAKISTAPDKESPPTRDGILTPPVNNY